MWLIRGKKKETLTAMLAYYLGCLVLLLAVAVFLVTDIFLFYFFVSKTLNK